MRGVPVVGVALEMDHEGLDLLYDMLLEAKRVRQERGSGEKSASPFRVCTPRIDHDDAVEFHQLIIV
jgi:hypothetical protein